MSELNFDTGLVTYKVNGQCEISFNPADVAFVRRLFNTFDNLSKQQDAIEGEDKDIDGVKLFELVEQREEKMRADIDSVFGDAVCDKLFGKVSVFALAGGLPLWCNFLMAVIDKIDAAIEEEQKQASPRVAKYMAKYEKYKRK